MNKAYYFLTLFFFSLIIISCSSDKDDIYEPLPEQEVPVFVNLDQVPYAKLSDYHFFKGDLKDHTPTTGVLPY